MSDLIRDSLEIFFPNLQIADNEINISRGNLIIYLVLNKEELFIKKLKKYFG